MNASSQELSTRLDSSFSPSQIDTVPKQARWRNRISQPRLHPTILSEPAIPNIQLSLTTPYLSGSQTLSNKQSLLNNPKYVTRSLPSSHHGPNARSRCLRRWHASRWTSNQLLVRRLQLQDSVEEGRSDPL